MNNTIILNTIAWISFNKFMREQGLFILNLIVNGKLLPLQYIQIKALHLCLDLCSRHKVSDNNATYISAHYLIVSFRRKNIYMLRITKYLHDQKLRMYLKQRTECQETNTKV